MTLFKHVVLDIKAHYCRLNIVVHANEYKFTVDLTSW